MPTVGRFGIRWRRLPLVAAGLCCVAGADAQPSGSSAAARAVAAQGLPVLRGVLRDERSRDGLAGGAILLVDSLGEPSSKAARTDSLGYFELVVPVAGTYRIMARRAGYTAIVSSPMTFLDGEAVEVELPVAAAGPPASPATILAREPVGAAATVPAAFAARRASRAGLFLGPNELRRAAARTVAELVSRVGGRWWRGDSRTAIAAPDSSACRPTWFLNGEPSELSEESLLRLPPAELRAAELYHQGIAPPPELAGVGSCGAIVLWAR
jgi:hypothetical protein